MGRKVWAIKSLCVLLHVSNRRSHNFSPRVHHFHKSCPPLLSHEQSITHGYKESKREGRVKREETIQRLLESLSHKHKMHDYRHRGEDTPSDAGGSFLKKDVSHHVTSHLSFLMQRRTSSPVIWAACVCQCVSFPFWESGHQKRCVKWWRREEIKH